MLKGWYGPATPLSSEDYRIPLHLLVLLWKLLVGAACGGGMHADVTWHLRSHVLNCLAFASLR